MQATSADPITRVIAYVVLMAITACSKPLQRPATPPEPASRTHGQVEHVVQAVPENQRYARLPGVTFKQAAARCDNAKPAYPAALLVQRLEPVSVSALLIVDVEGNVADVRPLYSEGVPDAFTQATVDAMKAWCFTPLERIVDGKAERLPYSDTYTFEFRQIDGKPVVE